MKRFYSVVIVIMILLHNSMAQIRPHCGHVEYQKKLYSKYPGLHKGVEQLESLIKKKKFNRESAQKNGMSTYIIPVVFHVIYRTSVQNISDEKILDQLKIINEDYQSLNKDTVNIPEEFKSVQGNMNIQFCLATRDALGRVSTGINRIYTNRSGFDVFSDQDDRNLKSLSYWPSDQYLNVWIVNLLDEYLGYATFPSTSNFSDLDYEVPHWLDGVVLSYKVVGNSSNSLRYNKGRSATHEIGHWLGLYHNWGDAPCGNDYVEDTPLQDSANISMLPNDCVHYSYCTGIKQLDMANNYMDYSPDACMNMFTKGQSERMNIVMNTAPRRKSLQNSLGCYEPISFVSVPHSENFERGIFYPADTAGNMSKKLKWKLVKSVKRDFYLKCTNDLTFTGDSIFYTTPYIDFTQTENPFMEVDLTSLSNAQGRTDSIVFSFSPNQRQVFTLQTLSGSKFTTTKVGSTTLEEAWSTYKIDLKPLAKRYIAPIKITFYSKGISDVGLNNVRVYDNQNKHEIKLYPLPARDKITAQITQDEYDSMTFEIINSLGKLMRTWTVAKDKLEEEIPLLNLSPGLYFLRTTFIESNQIRVSKFIVD